MWIILCPRRPYPRVSFYRTFQQADAAWDRLRLDNPGQVSRAKLGYALRYPDGTYTQVIWDDAVLTCVLRWEAASGGVDDPVPSRA